MIKHENTRFKEDPFKDGLIRTKLVQKVNDNKNNAGEKIGHDGKSVIPQESPRVGGYGFVATPSPMPGISKLVALTAIFNIQLCLRECFFFFFKTVQ